MPQVHWDSLYDQRRNLEYVQTSITVEEIRQVIREWPNNKSPGSDSFTGEFYKAFVDILLLDIHAVFQTVMDWHLSLQPLNTSYIALIPKIDHLTKPTEYRLISLIHAIQRIFSKVLANRIKNEMQYLIGTVQTGFVKDRQITGGSYTRNRYYNMRRNKISHWKYSNWIYTKLLTPSIGSSCYQFCVLWDSRLIRLLGYNMRY